MQLARALLVLASTVVAASVADAGTVEQAQIIAEPQMMVSNGSVNGCGILLRSIVMRGDAEGGFTSFDSSFNVYADGFAMMKGGAKEGSSRNGTVTHSTRQVESFWLKAQGQPPTRPISNKVLPAQDKGYLLYGIEHSAAAGLFDAVLGRQSLVIGVRLKGEPVDRMHAGIARISDADHAQVLQCFGDLSKRMREELGR